MTSQKTVGFIGYGVEQGTTGGDALKADGGSQRIVVPTNLAACATMEFAEAGNSEDVCQTARWDRRPTLICTVGLPYSGLTTHARRLVCSQGQVPIVSADAIRLALHGQRFAERAEPMVWTTAHLMVSALFGAGHLAVALNACNVTTKRRAEWTKPQSWRVEFHHIVTPFETCLERAQKAGDHDILSIIQRMNDEWEPFTPTEREWPVRLFERGREIQDYPTGWGPRVSDKSLDGGPTLDEEQMQQFRG